MRPQHITHPLTLFFWTLLCLFGLPTLLSANPYVDHHQLKVTYKGSYTMDDSASVDDSLSELGGVFYGFTDDFGAGLEVEAVRPGDGDFDYKQTSLVMKYQLTEPGDYWWVMGLEAKLTRPDGWDNPYKGKLSFLLQHDSDTFRHRAYVTVGHRFGENATGGAEFALRWMSRYKLRAWFQPGIDWVGDFGELDDLNSIHDSKQYIGPCLFGRVPFLEKHFGYVWEYDIVHYFGITDASVDQQTQWKLELKMNF